MSSEMAPFITTSARYQRLVRVMEKALINSRAQFDIPAAIHQCYGEDASIFGSDEDVGLLQSVLEGMLDRVHDTVMEDMIKFLKEEHVEELLLKLERVVARLDAEEQRRREAEAQDKASARQALQEAKLPKGLDPADIFTYHSYQEMVKERDAMKNEIALIEQEIQQLEAKNENDLNQVNLSLQKVVATGKELEKSADMCSMISRAS